MRKPLVLVGLVCVAMVCFGVLRFTILRPVEAAAVLPTPRESSSSIQAGRPLESLDARPTPAMVGEERVDALPQKGAEAEHLDPAGEGELVLRFVEPNGASVPDAKILLLEDATEAAVEAFSDMSKVDASMEAQAVPHIADKNGHLRIPFPGTRPTLVVASSGTLWGRRYLDDRQRDAEPVEISLSEDATLRARVVAEDGTPVVGATVHVLRTETWDSWPVESANTEGDAAIAEFSHVQVWLDEYQAENEYQSIVWDLALDAALVTPVRYALDPESLPREVITLVAPATGCVAVSVFEADGTPFLGAARADLHIQPEPDDEDYSAFGLRERSSVSRPVESGLVVFDCVQPGVNVTINIHRSGSWFKAGSACGPGPTAAGQTSTVRVRLGVERPVVRVLVLNEEGLPLANEGMNVRVSGPDYLQKWIRWDATTDAEGVCLLDIPREHLDVEGCTLLVSAGPFEQAGPVGQVTVRHELQDGLNDLGTLRLETPPVLVRGRVLGHAGFQLSRSQLVLEQAGGEAGSWARVASFDRHVSSSGQFEIRGLFTGSRFRMRASAVTWEGPFQEFEAGATDLVLSLERSGSLAGRVLLEDNCPHSMVGLRIEGSLENREGYYRAVLSEDGTFQVDDMLPGEYSATVEIAGHWFEHGQIDRLSVLGGTVNRDPRLDPLDLQNRYYAHRISLATPDRRRAMYGELVYGSPGTPLRSWHWIEEAEFVLVTPERCIDLKVFVEGYLVQTVKAVCADVAVDLQPSYSVCMRLAGDVELPRAPLSLNAFPLSSDNVEEDNDLSELFDWEAAAFDENRVTHVRVSETGAMHIMWVLSNPESDEYVFEVDSTQGFELSDQPGQEVVVSLTPELLAKMLAQFTE